MGGYAKGKPGLNKGQDCCPCITLHIPLFLYVQLGVEEMATHSSILAWKIPWMEEPGRLQSTGSQRVGQDWVTELNWTERERKVKVKLLSHVQLFAIPRTIAYQASPSMGFFQATVRECCHVLLQGIFPTQGSNLGLPHCRQTLYPLSHQGSPGELGLAVIKYLGA